jgi:glycosyltransferase involved in cell wall biosynthesis
MPAEKGVVHVLGSFDWGGVESMSLRIMSGLKARGFAQHVVCTADAGQPGERFSELRALGIPVHFCPKPPGSSLSFVVRLARLLGRLRPGAVLSYSFGVHAHVAFASCLARVGRMYVRVGWGVARPGLSTRIKFMVLAHLARPFCQGEIVNSAYVRDIFCESLLMPSRRVILIPNGVDVLAIRARAQAAGKALADDAGDFRLLMIARLSETKDHDTLFRAVALVRDRRMRVCLDLAGDGPRRRELELLAGGLGLGSSVRFLGNRSDVAELLGGAHILVLSTHSEGMPNVLLEAMAAGTPIIATDLPPCREVLQDGRGGILVPPRSPERLADAIEMLARHPAARDAMAGAAFQAVRERFDIERCVGRYSALLGGGLQRS